MSEAQANCLIALTRELLDLTRRSAGITGQAATGLAVEQVRLAANAEPYRMNFLATIGTAATSLYLTNLGPTVKLHFGEYRQRAERANRQGPIYLLQGSERRILRSVEYLEIAPHDGDVWLQVEAH